ncbi:hypothetical protein MAPG_03262 [Magnaporthiopsis poae ATCC 64411]|uniref:Uncharacterized protein n=1 Tax=Magnaporthiopsis poae (strain ATCC 64411 / 73-15) TaxID=644358 RepID=A0A0C4DTJ4_MAGP6|nr:hypothetical protein MAPG_03262 [Magnaporthiopsis poae ATCC 64411]
MPPTLDLSGATHSKMIMAPPRLNLRRAASYQGDRGPLSSTSSRFNFNHLVFASPPPSPRLPTLVPPPRRRKSGAPRPSRVLKAVFWVFVTSLVLYSALARVKDSTVMSSWLDVSERYEMVPWDSLPDFASPIVLDDRKRGASWTVSIPPGHRFPLSVKEYSEMPAQCREVSARVNELRQQQAKQSMIHNPFSRADASSYFVDIREAEKVGILPGLRGKVKTASSASSQHAAVDEDRGMVGEAKGHLVNGEVCDTSLTFVLESADAGLGKTLMAMWTAYGLAQRQGRAFFVDDSRWAYGDYTAIFQPPPQPRCRSPPRHQILPCPYQARHLVVTPATAEDFFTATLAADLPAREGGRDDVNSERRLQKDRFQLARIGHDALFRLNDQDERYVSGRVKELSGKARGGGVVVGVHVRRGDRHPLEYQYGESYIPLEAYTERTGRILDDARRGGVGSQQTPDLSSLVLVASDDPVVYESEGFAGASRAQEQIKLASKTAIQKVNPDRTVMHKFVDEAWGWEGGFFSAVFWNLGRPKAGKGSGTPPPPSADTLRLRSLIGRAYMMDLAVLSRASDFVVCTVSAMGCRLMAVMMPGGWDEVVQGGRWVNIDGEYGWDGGLW